MAGMGVLVAGGGSVLTRTPLNGGNVSVGSGVGLAAGLMSHAASKTANTQVVLIHLFFMP